MLQKLAAGLNEGHPARGLGLSDDEKATVRDLFLLTLKPVMYVANVLEDGFENNPHLDRVRERAAREGAEVVPVSAAIEEEMAQLDEADRDEFLADMGLDEPGLNRVIRAGYKLLGMQTYFTAGVKEVRAWQVRAGATAPQAAGGHPHRLREGLHPRRDHRLRRFHPLPRRVRRPRCRPPAPGRQGIPGQGRRRAAFPLQRLTPRNLRADPESHSIQDVDKGGARRENYGLPAGGIPKRPTGADCKSAGSRLRWFESTSLHQFFASRYEDSSDEVRE